MDAAGRPARGAGAAEKFAFQYGAEGAQILQKEADFREAHAAVRHLGYLNSASSSAWSAARADRPNGKLFYPDPFRRPIIDSRSCCPQRARSHSESDSESGSDIHDSWGSDLDSGSDCEQAESTDPIGRGIAQSDGSDISSPVVHASPPRSTLMSRLIDEVCTELGEAADEPIPAAARKQLEVNASEFLASLVDSVVSFQRAKQLRDASLLSATGTLQSCRPGQLQWRTTFVLSAHCTSFYCCCESPGSNDVATVSHGAVLVAGDQKRSKGDSRRTLFGIGGPTPSARAIPQLHQAASTTGGPDSEATVATPPQQDLFRTEESMGKFDTIARLSKSDLVRKLSERNLATSGTKGALLRRLADSMDIVAPPLSILELTVPGLRQKLQAAGLDSKGEKTQLIARLWAARDEQADATVAGPAARKNTEASRPYGSLAAAESVGTPTDAATVFCAAFADPTLVPAQVSVARLNKTCVKPHI